MAFEPISTDTLKNASHANRLLNLEQLTFIQLHYMRSVGMPGTAQIMEDAVYGTIFSNTFPSHMPMALTMNYSKASSTQSVELGSIVNRFSARHLHKSKVEDIVSAK